MARRRLGLDRDSLRVRSILKHMIHLYLKCTYSKAKKILDIIQERNPLLPLISLLNSREERRNAIKVAKIELKKRMAKDSDTRQVY